MTDHYTEIRSKLPLSYVEFIESHNGWEGDLGEEFGYVEIWNRETIQERRDAYEMDKYLNNQWFSFGSDGGGEMLCFDILLGGDTVFWLPYIGMSDELPIERYPFASLAAAILRLEKVSG